MNHQLLGCLRLDVAAAGIATDAYGHVRTGDTYATSVPGIWTLSDLANHFQLKHMANAEARLVQHNLLHPGRPRRAQFPVVPSAVFADPQVASAGATEQDLQARGQPYIAATRHYRDAAYGWALKDTTSFVKALADPGTRLLPGAHLIGPQAPVLILPLVQAMCLGNTTRSLPESCTSTPRSPRSSSRHCSSCEPRAQAAGQSPGADGAPSITGPRTSTTSFPPMTPSASDCGTRRASSLAGEHSWPAVGGAARSDRRSPCSYIGPRLSPPGPGAPDPRVAWSRTCFPIVSLIAPELDPQPWQR